MAALSMSIDACSAQHSRRTSVNHCCRACVIPVNATADMLNDDSLGERASVSCIYLLLMNQEKDSCNNGHDIL